MYKENLATKITFINSYLRLLFLLNILLYVEFAYTQNYPTDKLNSNPPIYYTIEQGLTNNHIKSIQMDTFGFIWIGTDNGLSRFDGNHIVNYDLSEILGDKTCENRVLHMSKGKDGSVVGIVMYGTCFRAKGNTVEKIATPNAREFGLHAIESDKSIEETYYRSKYYLYINSNSKHYYECIINGDFQEVENGKILDQFNLYSLEKLANESLYFYQVAFFNNTLYYIDSKLNCYRWDKKWVACKILGIDHLIEPRVKHTIYISKQKYLQIDSKLFMLDSTATGDIEVTLLCDYLPKNFEATQVFYNSDNRLLLIGNNYQGFLLYHLENANINIPKLAPTSSLITFLPIGENKFIDGNGDIRLISTGALVKKCPNDSISYLHSILKDQLGRIWLHNGQLIYMSKSDNPFKPFRVYKQIEPYITCLAIDKFNRQWVFTNKNTWILSDGKETILPGISVIRAYILNDDNIELYSNEGFYATVSYSDFKCQKKKLPMGCRRIRHASNFGKFKLICTYGNGVYIVKENQFYLLPEDKNKSLRFCHSVFEISNQRLCFSTNDGLIIVKINDLLEFIESRITPQYYLVGKLDGLPIMEFNGGSQDNFRILNNHLVGLPGIKGVTFFDPNNFPSSFYEFKNIIIDNITENGKNLKIKGDTIECLENNSNLSIQFALPYYGDLRNLRIQYLTYPDQNWIDLSISNKIDLFKIQPGYTVLSIRVIFPSGNMTEKIIYIHNPEFILSKGNIILISILVIFVIFWLSTLLTNKYLKRKARKLEFLVNERTDDLKGALNQLKLINNQLDKSLLFREKVISIIVHDLLGPLRFASKVLENLSSKQIEVSDKRTIRNLKKMFDETLYASSDLLTWSKSQYKGFSITKTEFNLHLVVEECLPRFLSRARIGGKSLKNLVPIDYNCRSDKKILYVILSNIIENAIKYGEKGDIIIEVDSITKNTIKITNVGSKFDQNLKQAINDNDFNHLFGITNNQSMGGYGFRICLELIDLIGGQLKVNIDANTTTILIQL